MKIYLGGRGTGKTQRIINEASKRRNSIIVVATYGMKLSLEARLQHERKNYIRVMTIDEIFSDREQLDGMHDYKFFFDDVQNCLCTLMHHRSDIIGGMSINVEPVIDEVHDYSKVGNKMENIVERKFYNLNNYKLTYQNFDDVFRDLFYKMRDKIGHPIIGDQYYNLRFVMNVPLYDEFCNACQMSCKDSDTYNGIKVIQDPSFYVKNGPYTHGVVRLVYEGEPELKKLYEKYCVEDAKATHDLYLSSVRNLTCEYFLPSAKPHIDHVEFNGPATIVFWKDGTKTVVKHDGKGRKDKRLAILYAFIRKIYGESKPYHNILNEIEEAIE